MTDYIVYRIDRGRFGEVVARATDHVKARDAADRNGFSEGEELTWDSVETYFRKIWAYFNFEATIAVPGHGGKMTNDDIEARMLFFIESDWESQRTIHRMALAALVAERDRADRAEARIREARKAMVGNQTVNGVTDRGWLTPDEWLLDKVAEALGEDEATA